MQHLPTALAEARSTCETGHQVWMNMAENIPAGLLTGMPGTLQEAVRTEWQRWQRIRQAEPACQVPRERIAEMLTVWSLSEFVARTCERHPALLSELLDSGDLGKDYPGDEYADRGAAWLADCADEQNLAVALRRWRRREMVRIAWRDLAGMSALDQTLAELSALAAACTDLALAKLHDWSVERFGVPRDRHGDPQRMVVLGMGKLGGQELNFSSDIDLIFAYERRGETDGRRSLDNEEFFRRLGQKLIRVLDAPSEEGLVFRVDMRLRPFGEAGPLAVNFDAMVSYYQQHGREWERYALVKARPVAGDLQAGWRLLELLRPFVYRRYLDYGAFEALREMKALIAQEVERRGLQRNVKLGPGGIREIEFIAQAFQLIYGGREPALRRRRLRPVLVQLGELGHLPPAVCRELDEAYEFLRRTENRLQMWGDLQTHELPTDGHRKQMLAVAMGDSEWTDFRQRLNHHARRVEAHFASTFAAPEGGSDEAALEQVWHATRSREVRLQRLEARGYRDCETLLERLDALRQSYACRSLSRRGRARLDQLVPAMLRVASDNPDPGATLERLLRLVEAIARRSVYLALLSENPAALAQLARLCSASPWISEYLAKHPLLLDELLAPATLYQPLDRAHLVAEAQAFVERADAGDLEQQMDVLRQFQQTNVLRVAAAEISDAMPLMVVSDHLSWIAEATVEQVLALSLEDLGARYGRPRCQVDGETREPGFAVVAYGKLGGIELSYGSDLDLVFLHDSHGAAQQTDGPRQLDNATFFARLVQRMINMLTAHTPAGKLYEVDMRLRPSGRSGLLVTSLEAFAEYQRRQAWTWEHQALVRARIIAGSPDIGERFGAVRREILCRPREPSQLRTEVREMRERMRRELGSGRAGCFDLKQDPGGIADIEFMVQYCVLANADQYPELATWTDNIRQLEDLERTGLLAGDSASFLRDAYRALRRLTHLSTLQGESGCVDEQRLGPELKRFRDGVAGLWRNMMGA